MGILRNFDSCAMEEIRIRSSGVNKVCPIESLSYVTKKLNFMLLALILKIHNFDYCVYLNNLAKYFSYCVFNFKLTIVIKKHYFRKIIQI